MKPSSDQLIKDFYSAKARKKFSKGEVLVQPDAGMMPLITYIETGIIQQYDIAAGGEKTVINVFKPGAFFPASSAVNHSVNTYYFEAVTDTIVRQAKADEIETLLLTNPVIAYDLLKRLYRGIDGLLQKLASSLAMTARQRLLGELIISGERFGVKQDDQSTIVAVTAEQLAQRTGLARETVSRELKTLKDEGIVSMKRGEITLHATTALY